MKGLLFFVLYFLGLCLSVVLIVHDVGIIYGVNSGPSFCSFGGVFDCDKVAASPYSRIFDIPVASIGFLYYLALSAYALFRLRSKSSTLLSVVFVSSLVAMIPTIAMFYISLNVIKSFCLYCSGLYVVNTLIFLLALVQTRDRGVAHHLSRGVACILSFLSFGIISTKDFAPSRLGMVFLLTAAMVAYRSPVYVLKYYYGPMKPPALTEQQKAELITKWSSVERSEIAINTSEKLQYADFTIGEPGAPVTIVEFSDFECPHCRYASGEIKQAISEEKENVFFVFKNFPLDQSCNRSMQRQLHPNACRAAVYARCAGLNGNDYFWAMHDAIFSLSSLSEESLAALPDELGLDTGSFSDCLKDPQVSTRLQADIEQGVNLRIPGTPAIFINGRLSPSIDKDALLAIIRHNLRPK